MKKLLFSFTFVFIMSCVYAQWMPTNFGNAQVRCLEVKDNLLFAASYAVFSSSNNGSSWIMTGLTNQNITSFALKEDTIFAGAWYVSGYSDGGVYASSNNGSSWDTINNGLPVNVQVRSLAVNGTTIFAGTTDNVYSSSNNGNSWTAQSMADVRSFAVKDSCIFAGTDDYGIYVSSNNGNNWTAANNGLPSNFSVGALAIKGNYIFAGTEFGVYISTNNGNNWTAANNGLLFSGNGITSFAVNGNDIFAGTVYGVYHSSDNGSNWTAVNSGLVDTDISSLVIKGDTLFASFISGGIWFLPLDQLNAINKMNNEEHFVNYSSIMADKLTIKSFSESTMEIYNLQGQIIHQQQLHQGETNINIRGFAKGLYILRFNSNVKTETIKILKE